MYSSEFLFFLFSLSFIAAFAVFLFLLSAGVWVSVRFRATVSCFLCSYPSLVGILALGYIMVFLLSRLVSSRLARLENRAAAGSERYQKSVQNIIILLPNSVCLHSVQSDNVNVNVNYDANAVAAKPHAQAWLAA